MLQVTLYSRPDCHLCRDAAGLLRALQADFPFELREVNVDEDAALRRRFGDAIPVVAAGGRVIARAPIDERRLRVLVRQAVNERG